MKLNSKILIILFLWAIFFSLTTNANSTTPTDSLLYIKAYKTAYQEVNVDFDLAINLANESLAIAERLDDNSRKLKSLELLFNFHFNNSRDLEKASKYFDQIKRIPNDSLAQKEKANIYGLEAKLHMYNQDPSAAVTAIYNQLESLKGIYAPLETARANMALGKVESYQNNHKEAINHYKSAVQYFQQAKRITGLALAYDGLGTSYGNLNDFRQNIYYDSIALSIADTLKAPFIKMTVFLNYGKALKMNGRVEKSLSLTNKALSIAKRTNNQKYLAKTYNQLGAIYELENNPKKVNFFYNKAKDIAETLEDKELLISTYDHLHRFAIKEEKHKEAYSYLQKYTQAKQGLNNNNIKLQLANQKLKYESNKKNYEYLNLLLKENKLVSTVKKQNTIWQFTLLCMLLLAILAVLLYNSYKAKSQYNKRLEAEVKARTGDLKVANNELKVTNEKLKQSNLELEKFAYIASHDLKSPLRNIVSFLGLCKKRLKENRYEKIEEYIKYASDNASQMYTLIQDVLEYSRVNNNQSMTGWEKEVDLNEILANVIYNIDSDIKQKNAEVQTCPLPVVKGSKVHLLQLFQNLISNGIKYNANELPKVQLSHEENMDEHIIKVEDNGIGIETQYHEKVFDMFKRLHTQSSYSGTGLGLSICKKVIQDMKGRIWLESEPGIGTTFFVSIPKMPVQVMADQN